MVDHADIVLKHLVQMLVEEMVLLLYVMVLVLQIVFDRIVHVLVFVVDD
jgi:hypothetical protein